MRRGEIKERIDPKFIAYGGHQEIQAENKNSLGELVLQEPDYGAAERAVPMLSPNDTKYIRITDYGEDGIEDNHEFVTAEFVDEKYLIEDEDILFARSGATAGKTFIYSKDLGKAIFAGYCIRFRFDKEKVLPKYVYFYTKTNRYAAWVNSMQRAAGQPNINKEEYKSFVIPLPDLDIQRALVADVESARFARQKKLSQADELVNGIENYLMHELELDNLTVDGRKSFAVNLNTIRNKRLDPPSYRPYYKQHNLNIPTMTLGEIADIDQNQVEKPEKGDTLIPYIGLPECDKTSVREVVLRPYSEVKGRSIIKSGDILFARIEPGVFTKKYVLANDLLGYEYAYTSTEFYVVKAKENFVKQEYLYAMFFCPFVYSQIKGKTIGSSGRRRIDPKMFSSLNIPIPDKEKQKEIAREINRRRTQSRALREEAEREWQNAKEKFEKALLG